MFSDFPVMGLTDKDKIIIKHGHMFNEEISLHVIPYRIGCGISEFFQCFFFNNPSAIFNLGDKNIACPSGSWGRIDKDYPSFGTGAIIFLYKLVSIFLILDPSVYIFILFFNKLRIFLLSKELRRIACFSIFI